MLRFGAFQIDPRTWTLTNAGRSVDLSPRLVEILAYLAARAGTIVTKDELLDHFWPDVHIAENTLTRAIADIRKAIGDSSESPKYVQTLARRGYRFVPSVDGAVDAHAGSAGAAGSSGAAGSIASTGAPGSQGSGAAPVVDADAADPFRAWVKGRLALDSLDLTRLAGAVAAFERAVTELPNYAPAHAGLANAYLLQFETTRSGSVPDRELLTKATMAARQACVVEPTLGEGWAVLGYLLAAAGKTQEAQAAGRRATALEPDNWRHHYRLAYATWGEERLRAVDHALALLPGFAPAYMLSAMVFIARGALGRAEHAASLGSDAQRRHQSDQTPLPAAGLHWMRGLILAARNEIDLALASFNDEIATGSSGHVYAREFAANARVATGAIQLARGDREAAEATFRKTLVESPGHPRATLGLFATTGPRTDRAEVEARRLATEHAIEELRRGERLVEAALVTAGERLVLGEIDEAIVILHRLLSDAPQGPAGWIIPVDPMLIGLRPAAGYSSLLTKLAARAV
jgi:DNA-binding winged helix-turn-helix (wHTH) protein